MVGGDIGWGAGGRGRRSTVAERTADPGGNEGVLGWRQAANRRGTWRLDGCTIAVTLGPCPMCAGAMVNARLGRLIYGAGDPKAGAVDALYTIATDPRLNHQVQVIGGVFAEPCGKLLTEFFRGRRQANRERNKRRRCA